MSGAANGAVAAVARQQPAPVLALALGPAVGWALRWDEDHVASGVQPVGRRPAAFRRWLRELVGLSQARVVVWERRPRGAAALRLEGVLLAELEGRACLLAPARRASLAAARARWARPVERLREARALCALAWALDGPGAGAVP